MTQREMEEEGIGMNHCDNCGAFTMCEHNGNVIGCSDKCFDRYFAMLQKANDERVSMEAENK